LRRRRVLHIGAAGLAAMLVDGCNGGSKQVGPGGGGSSDPPSRAASTFDPATYSPPAIAYADLKKLYSYDSKSFLDAVLTNQATTDGVLVEDLTYTNSKGLTLPAYVATNADESGRSPGVAYLPAAGSNRDAWLPELKALAKKGIVAMVAEIPYKPTGTPAEDSAMVLGAVLAARRAVDLLSRRDDTDPGRLALVGHGWGGALAQIVSALDGSRLSGVTIASSGSRLSQTMVASVQQGDPTAYLNELTKYDGARYLSVSGKRQVLLQIATQDKAVPAAQATELGAVTTGTKERKDYATDNPLTFATAVADRATFLRKVLKVK
jgi:dienelactone hydrolase